MRKEREKSEFYSRAIPGQSQSLGMSAGLGKQPESHRNLWDNSERFMDADSTDTTPGKSIHPPPNPSLGFTGKEKKREKSNSPTSDSLWVLMISASSKFPAMMATWKRAGKNRDERLRSFHMDGNSCFPWGEAKDFSAWDQPGIPRS